MFDYTKFIMDETVKILSIDSPTGYTDDAADFVMTELRGLGYAPVKTNKGGVLVDLGGKNAEDGVLIETHLDTLGGMVAEIKGNGRLRLTNIGGMNPNNAETENVRVITKFSGKYEGTLQLCNASIHVNGDYSSTTRAWDKMEVVLDENVSSRDEVLKLGIRAGDFVCFEPRTRITEKGYIKSRFLDDKLSAAILLGLAKCVKEDALKLSRKVSLLFTVYEEVGHGGAVVAEDTTEMISVDMGCVGADLGCTERMVSICAKDSGGPYNYDVTSALADTAKEEGLDYAIDIYPHYGSDVEVTLRAGYDIRHGLIGPGVYASHNYERSHMDGVKNTLLLLKKYIQK